MEPSVCQASDFILGVYIAVNRQMSTLELRRFQSQREAWVPPVPATVDKPPLLPWDKMELLCVHLWPCLWRHGSRTGWTRPLDQEVQLISAVQWRSWLVLYLCSSCLELPAASWRSQLSSAWPVPTGFGCPKCVSNSTTCSLPFPPFGISKYQGTAGQPWTFRSGLGYAYTMFLILYCCDKF